MIQLIAYGQSVDNGGALTRINPAIGDTSVTVENNAIKIPQRAPLLLAAAAGANHASITRATLDAPSLRRLFIPDIQPLRNGVQFSSPPEFEPQFQVPYPLDVNEGLSANIQATPGAAVANFALAWLGDKAPQPVSGQVLTMRATATIQQVAQSWVSGALTFASTLPVGKYDVVGMRVQAATGVAARLVFPDSLWRPGVPVNNTILGRDDWRFRGGYLGVWGQFDQQAPPILEMFDGTAAAQVVLIDLIRRG